MNRCSNLDVYKGICIIAVIITHYRWTDLQQTNPLFPYFIEMAVPVFMIVSGYVSSLSFKKRDLSFIQSYYPNEICGKLLRYTIPFLPVYIFLVFYSIYIDKQDITVMWLIKFFIYGGRGAGSFYYPVMIQFVFIFPVIYMIVKKNTFRGCLAFFVLNVVYEVFKTYIDMSPNMYRLLVFRYIFLIAYGCYLFFRSSSVLKHLDWIAGGVGLCYLFAINYTNYKPIIMNQWTGTSCISVLFLVPIMIKLIEYKKLSCKLLETIGRASYYIMYIQLIYYLTVYNYLQKVIHNQFFCLLSGVIFSCGFGVLYYLILSPVEKKIIRFTRCAGTKAVKR